jgi:uncharacterized protein
MKRLPMKRLPLVAALCLSFPFAASGAAFSAAAASSAPVSSAATSGAAVSTAFAAPPSDAQIDTLMRTMDMAKVVDDIMAGMDKMSEEMGLMFLPENASASDRAELQAAMDEQNAITRRALSWDKIGPIYRKIYSQLLTAEEAQAMIDFYSTEQGRSIMRKTPKAMELAMTEMQPIMQTLIQDMQRSFKERAAKQAEKGE